MVESSAQNSKSSGLSRICFSAPLWRRGLLWLSPSPYGTSAPNMSRCNSCDNESSFIAFMNGEKTLRKRYIWMLRVIMSGLVGKSSRINASVSIFGESKTIASDISSTKWYQAYRMPFLGICVHFLECMQYLYVGAVHNIFLPK